MQSIYLSYLFRRTSTAGLHFALLSTPLDPYMLAHTRLAITQVALIIQVWASPAVVLIFHVRLGTIFTAYAKDAMARIKEK